MKYAHQMREQFRQLLGETVMDHIRAEVDAAPPPSPELVADLRRVFTRPGGAIPGASSPDARAA
ncbi:hypothetical protein [Streptomyces sp. NPDC048659]|uniref:hypothetical protein n=1 Tax=Streptomyces sp. NPDC048659 TaxID=3155489 RepID=UPI00342CB2D6